MNQQRALWIALCSAWLPSGACMIPPEPIASARGALSEPALLITEVAQTSAYAGSVADKIEVYCAAVDGCSSFSICDSTATGNPSCSSAQPALAFGTRSVVSRGNAIASGDAVWLAGADGGELPGTRVAAAACGAGTSRARADCAAASFGDCAPPGLGASAGPCHDEPATFRVAFTQNQHGQPEDRCTRPVCQQLMAAITAATTSIDFAIYGVRKQPELIDALVAASARGVRVRGVVDSENADCSAFGYPDTPALIDRLTPGSVLCDVGPGFSYIMHDKFFVFDATDVWTGSTNISDTELGGEYNSDVAVLIHAPALAAVYGAEFAEMFGGKFHRHKLDDTAHTLTLDGTAVESYFSPSDHALQNAVLPLIDNASASLDVAMFFFTDASIAQALLAAAARGVRVRMVLDATGATHPSSRSPQLCAAGIPVKVENWGGKSHSKWAVADAGTPAATTLFGSMNWTASGDQQNDENTLVVHDLALAAQFQSEFARQWADLPDALICAHVNAEGAASSVCGPAQDCNHACQSGACCDGVDNDHDGLIDLQEEACGCADGIDNDEDGFTDADDFDCQTPPDDP